MTGRDLTTAALEALSAATNYGLALGGGPAAPDLETAARVADETSTRLMLLLVGPTLDALLAAPEAVA